MDIVVRPIRESDIQAFWSVLDAVASEKQYLAMLRAPPLADVRAFVRGCIRDDFAFYVAERDGMLLGWAGAPRGRRDSTRHTASLGMGVLRDFRGRGVGRRLLETVVEHCWRTGLKRIDLEVFTDNMPARALYESVGFRVEGLLCKARLIDGEYLDVHHMALLHPELVSLDEELENDSQNAADEL